MLGQISSSDAYQDSVKELDAALREMTLYPSFPQVGHCVLLSNDEFAFSFSTYYEFCMIV